MCLAAVAHCLTPYRFLLQQSFDYVPCTQNLQQGEQEGPLGEPIPGDVPHAEGYNMVHSPCLSPEVWGGGQLLQGPHAASLTLFLPPSSLSFSSLCWCCLAAVLDRRQECFGVTMVLKVLWGADPGNAGGWVQVDVSLSSTWADP